MLILPSLTPLTIVSPVIVTPTLHPIVQDWKSRADTAGGTYTSAQLNAMSTMVSLWQSEGFIASDLATGVTSSSNIIQYCLPCCGTNSVAAGINLLYRSSVGTGSSTSTGSSTYNPGAQGWSIAGNNNFVTGFNFRAATGSDTGHQSGLFCIRTEQGNAGAHGAVSNSNARIISIAPGSTISSRMYDAASVLSTNNTYSGQIVILRNHSGGASSLSINGEIVASGNTSGFVTNSAIILSNNFLSATVFDKPITFVALSANGLPSSKLSIFAESVNTFKAASVQ